jgi:hypothetical protein
MRSEQEHATNHETEKRAESAAAEQPVIHDDQPADSHHGSPTQSEVVVGSAKLAGERAHLVWIFAERSGANYKAFAVCYG